MNEQYDQKIEHINVDLIVVGSGAAGMTAALTAKLKGLESIILEKTEFYGGSTAISGGGIWIPNNHLMAEAGLEDSPEKAFTYMQHTVGDRTSEASQKAFIKHAPEMLRCLTALPHMKFSIAPDFCDYYPERPGGMNKGRGVEADLFAGKKLGKLFKDIRIRPIRLPLDFIVTMEEGRKVTIARTNPCLMKIVLRVCFRNMFDKIFKQHHIAMGGALIARLRLSLHEQNVPIWLNTTVNEFIIEDGRIVGVEVEKEGRRIRIRSSKGVVLAAGGFPHNETMRKKYQHPAVSTKWTSASPGNTGDMIQMGMNIGADTDLMDDSWGMPTFLPPGEHPLPIVMERSYPGAIMVNSAGERFTKESASYVDVVHAMLKENDKGYSCTPSFLILDQHFRNRYFLGTLLPGYLPKKYLDKEEVVKADTLEELAEKLGIDANGLVATVKRYNEMVATGKDSDFGRGESKYDHFYSDPSVKPNCCLGTIEQPPFYAAKLYPGDIGTKGGLLTNENAQVLNADKKVIEGLYAAGNNSASVMGNTYPGPGSTIGPAMTFGYIAAMHAAGNL